MDVRKRKRESENAPFHVVSRDSEGIEEQCLRERRTAEESRDFRAVEMSTRRHG